MNDVVLSLETRSSALPMDMQRFSNVSLPFVVELGQELFSAHPRLQHTEPEKARRLALLIAAKNPQINAALFVAQSQSCAPEQVVVRFCQLSFDVMAGLSTRQERGELNTVATDREVWRRLAA